MDSTALIRALNGRCGDVSIGGTYVAGTAEEESEDMSTDMAEPLSVPLLLLALLPARRLAVLLLFALRRASAFSFFSFFAFFFALFFDFSVFAVRRRPRVVVVDAVVASEPELLSLAKGSVAVGTGDRSPCRRFLGSGELDRTRFRKDLRCPATNTSLLAIFVGDFVDISFSAALLLTALTSCTYFMS
eukprot:comp22434_c0_seq1/m.54986 comp22434_c0_seq1/g.54986  ORF comp22434_c0_seq1/g.54986 comp22434_c0_seq1/m.54986 type:complete len:188 (-) comp22434_c0_seq1:108-671(-)